MKPIIFFISILFVFTSCKKEVKTSNTIIANKKDTLKASLQIVASKVDYTLKKEECGKSFEVFFEQFSKDSIFQKSRVQYPLKELYIKSLDPTIIKIDTTYNSSEYNYIDFTEDKYGMEREYGKYTVEIEKIDSDSIHYKILGYDNGIHIIFKFKRVDTCWLLVGILDEST